MILLLLQWFIINVCMCHLFKVTGVTGHVISGSLNKWHLLHRKHFLFYAPLIQNIATQNFIISILSQIMQTVCYISLHKFLGVCVLAGNNII